MRTSLRSALLAAVAVAATLPAALAQPASPPAPPAPGAANQQPSPGGGQQGRGPGGAVFDDMDANKDGRVAWDEAWGYVQRRFASADANRDGGLTRQEADALRPNWGGRGGRRAEGGQPQAPTPEQEARRARFGDVVFRSVDANRDGRVTLEEVRPAIEARFRGLDANADNAVSRDELPQRRQGPRNGGGQAPANGAPAPAR